MYKFIFYFAVFTASANAYSVNTDYTCNIPSVVTQGSNPRNQTISVLSSTSSAISLIGWLDIFINGITDSHGVKNNMDDLRLQLEKYIGGEISAGVQVDSTDGLKTSTMRFTALTHFNNTMIARDQLSSNVGTTTPTNSNDNTGHFNVAWNMSAIGGVEFGGNLTYPFVNGLWIGWGGSSGHVTSGNITISADVGDSILGEPITFHYTGFIKELTATYQEQYSFTSYVSPTVNSPYSDIYINCTRTNSVFSLTTRQNTVYLSGQTGTKLSAPVVWDINTIDTNQPFTLSATLTWDQIPGDEISVVDSASNVNILDSSLDVGTNRSGTILIFVDKDHGPGDYTGYLTLTATAM